jgi:DNA-binding MurR/RpiR family transcriptional regulator
MLAKQYLEESIKISKEFKTDNAVIADFMKNQTEIFQQISDLIEPEEIVEEIELIAKSRISNDAKPNEKK